ncbi:HalX domain-containing protein [Salinirubellus salinus]|uniref:HalX domain-containing protein n=1 Tax=Salinirubellus salinus TaxID=1364945 RepID=A0A9E7U9F0_9EURY|nr:HalX domain-containing protein [Salinirubellus salinus]UWM55876.1 HalX domain-containing protein [Salinirubellus salinus]
MSDADGVDGGVLVCHHDESMRTAYERTLADHGFRVLTVSKPGDVPDLTETDVRAVVLSRDTPRVSPGELHDRLEGTHARVALVVPFDAETPAVERLPDRVDECLSDPVADERLVAAVERLLGRAEYDARLRRCFDLARRVACAEADSDTDASEVRVLRDRLSRLRAELDDVDDDIGAVDRFAVAAEADP